MKFNLYVHAWFDKSRVVFGQFVLLVLRPRVTTRGQDRYIMNTHLRNRFQTATATAADTPGLRNNRISAQTVRNRLRENSLHARRTYVACVLTQRHRQNRLN